ncbi:helix-turn-helix domain-containing protein [Gordonia neofelifaecis]|uniref:Helix-turn-helix domain-containing protein n=1 Tax=Gordonia neofelifaecis NRRL B-59395 TaxID=644548 RepID=F1YMV7_9ACTN|nr:helix-turn-helix transcriptional regulator [Gordonia neofelifaecis]EGD54042.1 helix-turn-helix domain-containing protein [Gordonia neofelifaecis NRRL B-59395]
MTLLLREAIGDELRRVRNGQGRTLREVSTDARVSLGYLSEVERGQKEASSELLASICEALDVPIGDVLFQVAGVMRPNVPDTLVEVIAPQDDSVDGAGAPAALAAA